ncbi:Protein of unknown function DUF4579 [Carpediemonas membranifera]|uniref:Uncharacterized protein n=1 Tax=Carpediemonas membranifera TaxID=201153 RepID=A0A8J6E3R0_9EUKA|nr:Protein of unknown function DUF4579 [Carpediemonas membranifera]|eukprot:KAG9395891.1 Protein of unknown function DUF4579 [Carpediemonas membranifera]
MDALTDVWQRIKLLYHNTRQPDKTLALKLKENPYHPFQRVGDQSFQLKRRYSIIFVSITLIVFCVSIMAGLVILGYQEEQYILWLTVLLMWACCLMWTFKNPREYLLDGEKEICTYRVGRKSVVVNYHNIYIRLRKSKSTGRRVQYQLIFNGQQLERQSITTRSTPNLQNLRKLGQQIAANLNINYFDELNMSRHHVIRHTRRNDVLDTLDEEGEMA